MVLTVACVAGGIVVSDVLSWRRNNHAKWVEEPWGIFVPTYLQPIAPFTPSCGVHGFYNVMHFWWTSDIWQDLQRALSEDLVEGHGEVNVSDAHEHVLFLALLLEMRKPCLPLTTHFGSHSVPQDRQVLSASESGSRWTAQRLCRQSSGRRTHCTFRSHLNRVSYVEGDDRSWRPLYPAVFHLPASTGTGSHASRMRVILQSFTEIKKPVVAWGLAWS